MKSRVATKVVLSLWSLAIMIASDFTGAQPSLLPPASANVQTAASDPASAPGRAALLLQQRQEAFKFLDDADFQKRSVGVRWLRETETPVRVAVPLLLRYFRAALTPESEMLAAQKTEQGQQITSYRFQLLSTLIEYGAEAREALPDLMRLVRDPKTEAGLRENAVIALGRIGIGSPNVVAALVLFLTRSDRSYLTTSAPDALARLGATARSAVPALEAELIRPDAPQSSAGYRDAVFYALGAIVGAEEKPLPAYLRQLHRWQTLSPGQLAASLQAVAKEGRKAQAIVPILAQIAQERNVSYITDVALSALAQTGVGNNVEAGQAIVAAVMRTNPTRETDSATAAANALGAQALRLTQASDTGLIAPILAAIQTSAKEEASGQSEQIWRETALLGALSQIGPGANRTANSLADLLLRLSLPSDASLADQSGLSPIYRHAHHRDLLLRLNLYTALAAVGLPHDPARHAAIVECIRRDLDTDATYPGAQLVYVGAARAASALSRNEAARLVPALTRLLSVPGRLTPALIESHGAFMVSDYGGATTTPVVEAARTLGKLGNVAAPALPALAALITPNAPIKWPGHLSVTEAIRDAIARIQADRKQPKT